MVPVKTVNATAQSYLCYLTYRCSGPAFELSTSTSPCIHNLVFSFKLQGETQCYNWSV